jgi:CDP-diacylglycerol--serine O-phosphatidyltransferase
LRFIGFYDYTVILTYASLASAILGIFEASKGNLRLAVFCIIGSGLCDMFDGVVARSKKDRTQDQKNFGIQIDSLVDVIAFGVTPAAVFYFHGVNSAIGVAILIFYVMCGVIRLGFFNVLETKRQSDPTASACLDSFRGMPITFSSMITPLACPIAFLLPSNVSIIVYHIVPLIMGFLFILDFKMPKINIAALFSKK